MQWVDSMKLQASKTSTKTYNKEQKLWNHGGSPPNLGLKEATPAPGEIRHKRKHAAHSHSMQNHNSMTKFDTTYSIHPIPRLYTKIRQMNQE